MQELDEIRRKLKDRRLYMIAKATGVTYQTLLDIRDGRTQNPTIMTVQKIKDYLNATA
jgi:hypothetical protein